ncbi:FAD-binding oxidoreductase [Aeromicrobium sp.]|uniref:FAD-binding oxidoreductase n=1 Tax=Aeromicrobium sp. TaxID=1871063 RepID=UPI002FC90B58
MSSQPVPVVTPLVVNDTHSLLNETKVARVVEIGSVDDIIAAIAAAEADGLPIAIGGGRHAMGGQQFCEAGVLLDMRACSRVLALDTSRGLVTVEAGIMWPELVAHLLAAQPQTGPTDPAVPRWGIRQKQTGADRLTLGGSISANAHGRGLAYAPIVQDVEELTVVDAQGVVRTCSRTQDADLFGLVIGGYGLFGVIYSVTLRLEPRRQVERVVEVRDIGTVGEAFGARIADGFTYGDFQFSIDEAADDFLERGVFSCYRPISEERAIPADQKALTREEWGRLLYLAHTDRAEVTEQYIAHYLATTGQLYWSDTHQMADYVDGYHAMLDEFLPTTVSATEVISEIYVPRDRLMDFMSAAATYLRRAGSIVVYGTVRLIERDDVTFLAWAREPYACVIFNLHTEHTPDAIDRTAEDFRHLIDLGIERGGSFFLTYHRWARRDQIEACYPQMPEFLARKLAFDPHERFQSDWYRHLRDLFTG